MLDGDTLLDLCQRGSGHGALVRAALLGELVAGAEAGATLSLGELDRRIWRSRAEDLSAANLPLAADAVCDCPHCGARLEFSLPADFAPPEPVADSAEIEWAGRTYPLRMPTLADFGPLGLRLAQLGDGCWEDPAFAARAGEALQASDPALGLDLALACPDCGAEFAESFDPAGFFWAELEDQAARLLTDIMRLAGAFGWSEREILGLSPARRALYIGQLDAAGAGI